MRSWLVLGVIIGIAGATTTISSLKSDLKFEEQSARIVAAEEARSSGLCPLDARTIENEQSWLIAICAQHGLTVYDAAHRHPDISRQMFEIFGNVPEFVEEISDFGPKVIEAVSYITNNGSTFIQAIESIKDLKIANPTPTKYGLGAIYMIKKGGEGFLAQFHSRPDGTIDRLRGEQILFVIKDFLTSGLTNFEKSWRSGKAPTLKEYLEATLDVAILAGPLAKTIKIAGEGEVAAKEAGVLGKIKNVTRAGEGLISTSSVMTGVKIGAVALTVVAVTRPVWATSAAYWLAEQIGLPESTRWLVPALLWIVVGLVLSPIMLALLPLALSVSLWLVLLMTKATVRAGFKLPRLAVDGVRTLNRNAS